jgi:hypothetical protein
MIHTLKTWPALYNAMAHNGKNFEIRKNDRRFITGDLLILQEYDINTKQYTGNIRVVQIKLIFTHTQIPGLQEGYVAMAVENVPCDDYSDRDSDKYYANLIKAVDK